MKTAAVVVLTVVSLIIGLLGIGLFIGVGEGSNNAIVTFAAVSLPFALLTGFFSWLMPRARWSVAAAMSTPLIILCVMDAPMGWVYLPGAIWTALFTTAGANIGGRLRQTRAKIPPLGTWILNRRQFSGIWR